MKAAWLLFFFSSSFAFAESSKLGLEYNFANPYDVVVPALNGDPAGADRQVGQVYLDISSGSGGTGALKVVGKDGSVLTFAGGSSAPVVSGGDERIERARFTNTGSCAVASFSGATSWISMVSDPGVGRCGITIASGVFSGVPSCVVTSIDTVMPADVLVAVTVPAASGGGWAFEVGTSAPTVSVIDRGFNILCMGPQ